MLYFLHKVRITHDLIFIKATLDFCAKRSLKWAQNVVFQVLWKINAWNISDILHEVTVA